MTIEETSCTQALPPYGAIDPLWRYQDPTVAEAQHAGPFDASQERHEWARLDLSVPTHHFLLAAENHPAAQRILDDLSALHAPGIRARPLLPRPDVTPPQPYAFFWGVATDRYDPFLLQSASRVWWRLNGRSQRGWLGEVYLQHPWSLDLPAQWLFDLPWPEDAACILIGPDAPTLLCPTLLPDGGTLSDYLQAVRLHTAQPSLGVALSLPAAPRVEPFRVTFTRRKLGPAELRVQRLDRLRREIEERQLRLARLGRTASDVEERPDLVSDLLFLIPQPDAGSVAADLQRLYIEWSDQPESLGQLRHALLPANRLADVGLRAHCAYHVVTTASALGQATELMARARLAEHSPQEAASRCLALADEWARHGLALFLPTDPPGQHVALYPDLRPTPLAAQRLAQAIEAGLGPDQPPAADRLHLLLPVADDAGYRFLVLRKGDFRPLSEAFHWHLAIEPGVSAEAVAASLTGEVRARQYENAIVHTAKGLQLALAERVKRRVEQLNNRLGRLKQRLDALDRSASERERAISRLADEGAALDRLQAQIEQDTTDTQALVEDAVKLLKSMQRRLWRAMRPLHTLRWLGQRQHELQASMRAMLKRLKSRGLRDG
jgi:hypothetical protein